MHRKYPQLKITLKLKVKPNSTFTYHSYKSKRIYSIVERQDFLEALIIINYGRGLTNRGIYYSKKDLKYALKCFTEKSLVEEIQNGQF